jgi:hypothetical protein
VLDLAGDAATVELAAEDLVHVLTESDHDTGIDLDALLEAAHEATRAAASSTPTSGGPARGSPGLAER